MSDICCTSIEYNHFTCVAKLWANSDSLAQLCAVLVPAPELCLLNVVFDGTDVDAFLASLGAGLPGTYVLRLAGEAQASEVRPRRANPLQP